MISIEMRGEAKASKNSISTVKFIGKVMRRKIQIIFFIVLVLYVGVLSSGFYVSVYITYTAIPTLAILGLLGFGSFKSIHKSVSIVFWLSLILTIATVFTVSYVGAYLVYIVVPIFLTLGLIMIVTKSKN